MRKMPPLQYKLLLQVRTISKTTGVKEITNVVKNKTSLTKIIFVHTTLETSDATAGPANLLATEPTHTNLNTNKQKYQLVQKISGSHRHQKHMRNL